MIWTPTSTSKTLPGSNILLLQDTYPFALPEPPRNEKSIINYDKPISQQFWTRPTRPKNWDSLSVVKQGEWIEEETRRCFEDGVWIFIKGMPIWIPPAYYFTLTWFYTKVGYLDFRISQLLEEYFELFCEGDQWCIGTFSFKKRRDGKTTRRMARKLWKAIQTHNGWFGIQSKTGKDAKNVCWKILMTGYKRLPVFWQPETSGMTDPKLMLEFAKQSVRITKANMDELYADIFRENFAEDDLNTTVDWRDTVSDAYDGQQVVEVDLDEFGKWLKASALEAAYTYMQSASLDGKRVGLIHCYTSPPEKDGKGLEDCKEMWDAADYSKIKHIEAFKFYRWLTSSLDSYAGAIDQFGYCDSQKAYEMIKALRDSAPQSKKKAVVRQTVMNIEEIFDSVENDVFITAPEIRKRFNFLTTVDYKRISTKERKYVYGNFEWNDGLEWTGTYFKPAENQDDFSWNGRWAMIHDRTKGGSGNTWREKRNPRTGQIIKYPSLHSEHVMGIDPYDFRRTDSPRPSNGSAAIGKCFDFFGEGGIDVIDALYNFRPKDPTVMYADMIKGAVYYDAWVDAESRNMKCIDYFEDNGYFEYLLVKDITDARKKDIKGTPTTSNTIQEICSLIEAHTSTFLETYWHEMILDDYLHFDPNMTKKSNITMAVGHMLRGFAKRRKLKLMEKAKPSRQMATDFAESILGTYFQ